VDKPQNPNIQWVNLKSTWKPFQIAPPANAKFDICNGEKTNFTFECWNHWLVGQIQSSGRSAVTPDRASETSLSQITWDAYQTTDNSITKIMLDGLTQKTATELIPLAKSWLTPPEPEVVGQGFRDAGYDPTQRAFVVVREDSAKPSALECALEASEASPVVNPAIVMKN
jgi:hypothetical protein